MDSRYEPVVRAIVRNEPEHARQVVGLQYSSAPALHLRAVSRLLKLKDWSPDDLELLFDALSWDDEEED